MGGRRSRPVVWAAVVVGILVVVAAGIAANIALLDATDSDGLGELTPVVATDVRPARTVTEPPPPRPTRPTATRANPGGDDDDDGHSDDHRFDDD